MSASALLMSDCESVVDDEGRFDEVREAAEAVLASLKWLIQATERVIADPEAMAAVAATGRSFVDAFTTGFRFTDNRGGSEASAADQ